MRPPLPGIHAVLFDLDGTLVHTNIDFAGMKEAVLTLAEAENVPREGLEGRDGQESLEGRPRLRPLVPHDYPAFPAFKFPTQAVGCADVAAAGLSADCFFL